MNLHVLVSTMHQKNHDLVKKMNLQSDSVVINQCDIDSTEKFNVGPYGFKWVNSKTRGLSISRNLALSQACSGICLLADDDLVYVDNYRNIVIEQFKLNPLIDIIAFQVEGIEKKFKNYRLKETKVGFIRSLKISSVEIAFKVDKILENNIKFNELFGAGGKYSMGEENIFLTECLRHGLRIKYVPIKIANLHIGDSSWFNGFNNKYFIDRGAGFEAMVGLFSIPLIFQFAIRKYSVYKENYSILEVSKLMLDGRSQYRKQLEDKD